MAIVGVVAAAALGLGTSALRAQAQAQVPIALISARVFASPEAAPLDDISIVIDGGRTTAMGPRDSVRVPPGAMLIDCRRLVVVAGFQNSHVHFTEPQWENAAGQPAAKLTAQLQSMLTAFGFTTVVDTGSSLENTNALRQRIAIDVAGPRVLTAGPPLYPPNGIPYYLQDGSVPPEVLKQLPQPRTSTEAQATALANIDGGADIIKLFTGSWVTNQRVLPMPLQLATDAVEVAHRRGKLVFAHASNVAGLDVALASGVDVIAHALDDTRGLTVEHLRRMKLQNMMLIPTLTLFGDSANAGQIFSEVVDYQRLGGDILFGTDVGYHQMYDPRLEYESLTKAGLTWQQILASLTTTPARRFKEANRKGRVARGMDADLVLLGTDPRAGAQAFTDVRYTIRSGTVIYQR